jgi:hypothetical protein
MEVTTVEYKPKYDKARSLFESAITRVDRETLLESKDEIPNCRHYHPKFSQVER